MEIAYTLVIVARMFQQILFLSALTPQCTSTLYSVRYSTHPPRNLIQIPGEYTTERALAQALRTNNFQMQISFSEFKMIGKKYNCQ